MPNTCHIYREYWGIAGNNNTLDSEYNREDIEVICGRVKYYVWNLPLSAVLKFKSCFNGTKALTRLVRINIFWSPTPHEIYGTNRSNQCNTYS